jgi:ParB family chromosome partitioning protein
MAVRAEELLAGSAWIPEPLRTPGRAVTTASPASDVSETSEVASLGEETALAGYETAMVDPEGPADDARILSEHQQVAAE